jgi:hypothetical protein
MTFTRLFAALLLLGSQAFAAPTDVTHLGLGIVPPAQFPPSKFSVKGLRLSVLWGRNENVTGIDLGLIGNTTKDSFTGSAVSGIFNLNEGNTTIMGVQLAGITNMNLYRTRIFGIQAALAANIGDTTDIFGVQIGIYNRARTVYGVQIGLINFAKDLHGVQIGLANFNEEGPFTVAPLINVGF